MNWVTICSPRDPQNEVFKLTSKQTVPIEWDKLASVDLHDLNSGQCSVEILQEHLNHIAFCCPERELKLDSPSGQRNMFKMFKLAQMIIQYLFVSQEYMESKMTEGASEQEKMNERYAQIKNELQKQVEEAKRIKRSNNNLKESLIYMNSLLSSMGAMEHYRCPSCPKAFRSRDFILSHLQRKHPQQAISIDVSKCLVNKVHPNPASISNSNGLNLSHLNPNDQIEAPCIKSSIYLLGNDPSTNNELDRFKQGDYQLNNVNISSSMKNHLHDIDSYKGAEEIHSTFLELKSVISKLQQDIKSQKEETSAEKENTKAALRKLNQEKEVMEKNYQQTLKDLSEKILILQTQNSNDQEIQEGITYKNPANEHEKVSLSKLKNNKNILEEKYTQEMKELKHKLKMEYETCLKNEREMYKGEIEQLKAKAKKVKKVKKITRHKTIHNCGPTTLHDSKTAPKSMYALQTESFDSSSETSHSWPRSKNQELIAIKYQTSSNQLAVTDREKNNQPSIDVNSSPDSGDSDNKDTDDTTKRNLKILLDKNPMLWKQMKDIVKMELDNKTMVITGKKTENGISTDELNRFRIRLSKERQSAPYKTEEFYKLRKEIENKVNLLAENNVAQRRAISPKSVSCKTSRAETIKGSIKKFRLIMKEKSKQLKSVLKHTDHDKSKEQSTTPIAELIEECVDVLPNGSCQELSDSDHSSENISHNYESKIKPEADNEKILSVKRKLFSTSSQDTSAETSQSRMHSSSENKAFENIREWSVESGNNSDEYVNLQSKKSKNIIPQDSLHEIIEESEASSDISDIKWTPKHSSTPEPGTGPKIKELASAIQMQMDNSLQTKNRPFGAVAVFGGKYAYR